MGRPCQTCISPAIFTFKQAEVHEVCGTPRRATVRSKPLKEQPAFLRGKRIRRPRRARAVAALRMATRWSWGSLSIALIIHVLLLVIAVFFNDELREVVERVQKVTMSIQAPTAPAPIAADTDSLTPNVDADLDDRTMVAELLALEESLLESGDPDYIAPPEKTYAPEPEIGPVAPLRAERFRYRLARAGAGLGSGQPDRSRNRPTGSGLFQNRHGESKRAAIRRHGGDAGTESAVNLGLAYLARRQSSNGSWDPRKGLDVTRGVESYRGALTALCTLPFLAAGHSPAEGKYARNVERAIRWLMKRQTSDGCVASRNRHQMYTHTVGTIALCEAYGLTQDKKIGRAAERAVRFLERTQSGLGGWTYQASVTSSGMTGLRNDLSISGWAVLALKSARAVGIRVSPQVWSRMADLYDRYSLATGETYYADEYPFPWRRGIAMVGVGLTSRVILDKARFEKRNQAAEALLAENAPDWERFSDPHYGPQKPNFNSFYGWYYGTLGLFLKTGGNGPAWDNWNRALKEQLTSHQIQRGANRGAWNADDNWIGPILGRLYSTALSVLCLEVYYRYNPTYREGDLPPPSILNGGDPEPEAEKPIVINGETLDLARPGHRSKYLRILAKEKGLGATGRLVEGLEDESLSVRSTSLYLIARLKAEAALPAVTDMFSDLSNNSLRATIAWTIGRIGDKKGAKVLINLLMDSDASVADAARSGLKSLAGGKDHGTNRRAWENHFGL